MSAFLEQGYALVAFYFPPNFELGFKIMHLFQTWYTEGKIKTLGEIVLQKVSL